MFRRIRNMWKPANYQGKRKMRSYFEGWYFKIVDKSEDNVYAIIPGVSFDKKGETVSFIQFFDGKKAEMTYFEYNVANFHFSKTEFDVSIGQNRFSSEFMELDIHKDGRKIQGKISHSTLHKWPIKAFSPGVMGN